MRTRHIVGIALLAAGLQATTSAQDLLRLGGFELEDLAEATVLAVVGSTDSAEAARWTPTLGLTTYPGALQIRATSADGTMHAGWRYLNGAIHATRWTDATGWVDLPQPADTVGSFLNPHAMSADGTVIVGTALWDEPGQPYMAFRWTESGGSVLLTDSLGTQSLGECVSGDGAWAGGTRRIPSVPHSRAVRWSAGGAPWVVIPDVFPGGTTTPSSLTALNHDGSMGAGWFGDDAYLWVDGVGPTLLARPAGATDETMVPTGMSDDGTLIVGRASPPVSATRTAWCWTPLAGTRWISDLADQLDLDPGPSPEPFLEPKDCSANGLRIGGTHPTAGGGLESWVVFLPTSGVGQVIDLKKSLAGSTTPSLEAKGSFGGGTQVTLELRSMLGLTTAHLVIGLSKLGLPFKGGTMVPNPDLVISFLMPGSKVDIPFSWPTGLPAGVSTWYQVWQPQPGGPLGWAASNALQVITP